MSILTEALKEIIGSTGHNGNGAVSANGKEKSPSERAWDTAREKAREQGQTVRDYEIRCIKTKGISPWAKLLFWILSKICWETSDFLFDKRVGSVCITGPQLQRHFYFPEKRLYKQTKKVKDKKTGKILASRTAPGAIEELVRCGFIWIGKKPIQNIPKNKWPNVFNLMALVSQREQQNLGLLEDVVIVEEGESQTTNGGSSLFLPENPIGSGQTPQNGPASNQRGELAATNGGSGQTPRAGLGSNQRGELAATNGGSSEATNGGSSPPPRAGFASNRGGELADTESGAPIKTSDVQDVHSASSDVLPKRSTALHAQNESKGKHLAGERIFLLDVACVIDLWRKGASKMEMEEFGKCWRLAFRTDPTIARAVLLEIRSMVKERKISRCPSAAAFAEKVGVWFIFGGPSISRKTADEALAIRKQKAAGGTAART